MHIKQGEPPWEYTTLILCRDVYHCLPSQLDNESAADIFAHLACLDMETRINKIKSKSGQGR